MTVLVDAAARRQVSNEDITRVCRLGLLTAVGVVLIATALTVAICKDRRDLQTPPREGPVGDRANGGADEP
jgi:hypothetical protein